MQEKYKRKTIFPHFIDTHYNKPADLKASIFTVTLNNQERNLFINADVSILP